MSEYTKYSGTINVFPNKLKMDYKLNIDYVNKSDKTNKIKFIIYDFNISLPNDYYLISGQKLNDDGTWSLAELEKPHCSIDFISAKTSEKSLELLSKKDRKVNVHDLTLKKSETRDYLQSKVDDIMSLFILKFGNLKKVKLDIVLVPRTNSEFSGGYCRPNLIVVPGYENISNANNRYSNDEKQYLLEYLLHEIGHLWWSKANFLSFEIIRIKEPYILRV